MEKTNIGHAGMMAREPYGCLAEASPRVLSFEASDNDGLPVSAGRRYVLHSPRPYLAAPTGFGHVSTVKVCGRGPSSWESDAIHVRFQNPASWLTPQGVWKKRRALELRGLPDFKGRRFLTLTLDPMRFGYCALTGYQAGKEHLRRFLESGRLKGLWPRGCWWCWKLEFQRNGWAHWHLIVDQTKKFSRSQMNQIHELWGLGRTNVRRISKGNFGYQFKYAFKGVYQDDEQGDTTGLCVPDWFACYFRKRDGVKPESFARARFWQTSKGFYTGKPLPLSESKEPQFSILPRTVEEQYQESCRSLIVIARDRSGKYMESKRLLLGVSHVEFIRRHLWDAEHGAGCTLSFRSLVLDPKTLPKLIEPNQKCYLSQLLQVNQFSLKRALHLRKNQKSLERC